MFVSSMIAAGMAFSVAVFLSSNDSSGKRVSDAIQLFEDVCLPYAYGDGELPLSTAPEFVELKRPINPNIQKVHGEWLHVATNMVLEIKDHGNGQQTCSITDQYDGFNIVQRNLFEKLTAAWVSENLPMLTHAVDTDLVSSDLLQSWLQYDSEDPRRWGVIFMRSNADLSYTTTLTLALSSASPRL